MVRLLLCLVALAWFPASHAAGGGALDSLQRFPSLSSALDLLANHHSQADIEELKANLRKGGVNLDQPFHLPKDFRFEEKPLQMIVHGFVLRLREGESLHTALERFTHVLAGEKYGWLDWLLPRADAAAGDFNDYAAQAGIATVVLLYATAYVTNPTFKDAADMSVETPEVLKIAHKQITQKIKDVSCLGGGQPFQGVQVTFVNKTTVKFEKPSGSVVVTVNGAKKAAANTSATDMQAQEYFEQAYKLYEGFCKLDPALKQKVLEEFHKDVVPETAPGSPARSRR
jgi:hypothetical protein